jgi:hypothetical protein
LEIPRKGVRAVPRIVLIFTEKFSLYSENTQYIVEPESYDFGSSGNIKTRDAGILFK